jgi:hypothetical protein
MCEEFLLLGLGGERKIRHEGTVEEEGRLTGNEANK